MSHPLRPRTCSWCGQSVSSGGVCFCPEQREYREKLARKMRAIEEAVEKATAAAPPSVEGPPKEAKP